MTFRFFVRTCAFKVFFCRLFVLCACVMMTGVAWAENATLNFEILENQIDAYDGAGICQFDAGDAGTKINWSNGVAWNTYSTLGGFPDDSSSTDYGKLLDTAFSARTAHGMALQTLWFSPTAHQSPANSIGDTYNVSDFSKQNFSYYEADTLLSRPFWQYQNNSDPVGRGHTVDMLKGALSRARNENLRMVLWSDLHFANPAWTWQSNSGWKSIPAGRREEICLFNIYFIKWLASRHGIPIHAVSFQNEPNRNERHNYSNEEIGQITRMMRQKLDEAGMHGVKVLPGTWHPQQLGSIAYWFASSGKSYLKDVDAFGHHMFGGSAHNAHILQMPNVRYWASSGNYVNWARDGGGWNYNMGVAANMDEIARINSWHVEGGVNLNAVWQLYNRLGLSGNGFFTLPKEFDPATSGNVHQRKNGAVVNPYVRPGMFIVRGSNGNDPLSQYSVDGFAGRGHAPVIVISNHGSRRTFDVTVQNAGVSSFEVYQADPSKFKTKLADQTVSNSVVSITVPANSVTTLVGKTAGTRPRVYLVVKNKEALTTQESDIQNAVNADGAEVVAVNQSLSAAEQNAFLEKRHPVDMPGAACYIIGPSVDDTAMGYRYRTVMAPVVVFGNDAARKQLGLDNGSRVTAGSALDFRDPLDPPANMLSGGTPLATGDRAALATSSGVDALAAEVAWAIENSGATDNTLSDSGYIDPDPTDPTSTDESSDGTTDEFSDNTTDETTDGTTDEFSDNATDESTDMSTDESTDDVSDQSTAGSTDTAADAYEEITIEAENYSANSGGKKDTYLQGWLGSGYFDMGGSGSWVEYSINVESAGGYNLDIRYANGSSADRVCDVIVNGTAQTNLFDVTSNWTTWIDSPMSIDLKAGDNTIRIHVATDRGGPNIDQLVIWTPGS